MSLAALRDRGPKPKGCIVGRWARTLPEAERMALEDMLDRDSGWDHKELAEHINADDDYPGVTFTPDQLRKHRNGDCSCERAAAAA